MRGRAVPLAFAACVALTASSPRASAQAQDKSIKKECAAAYEQAQVFRKERRLIEAQEQLAICAQKACPIVVRKECGKWQAEVEAAMPTVVLEVRDATGQPAAKARVFLDGTLLTESIDATAIPVNPGEHVFRYEMPGADPIEQGVTIREGTKDRKLSVELVASAPPPSPPKPSPWEPPLLGLVFAGVGALGVGGFTALGIVGINQRDELRDTCAPACAESDVSSVRTKLLLADISLGVGVVSLGVATYFFVSSLSSPAGEGKQSGRAPRLWVDVAPAAGGGVGIVRGAF